MYEVEFPDGTVKEYAANIIAENILRQVDPFGRYTHVMDGIIGHKKNDHALEFQTLDLCLLLRQCFLQQNSALQLKNLHIQL